MSPGKRFGAYSGGLEPRFLWKPLALGAGQRAVKGDGRKDEGGGDKWTPQEYFGGLGLGRGQCDSGMTKPVTLNRQSVAPWFCIAYRNALYFFNVQKIQIEYFVACENCMKFRFQCPQFCGNTATPLAHLFTLCL